MKLSRSIGYFSQLRSLLGFRAACAFALSHLWNKLNPPRGGKLAYVPVGPYVFHFPSLDYFVGMFTEIFFKETYYLASTQEPIRAIDCGANIGMALLYIKIRAPHARVLCFEPNPAARAVLEKNIAANNWNKEVRVLPYALGEKKGTVDFFVEGKETTSSGGSIGHHQKNTNRGLNSYPVEMDILSHYIENNVDFLKIDIEGAEFDVLEELKTEWKLPLIAALQLEYHYIPGFFTRPLSELLALLESEGFRTFVESNTPPHKIVGRDAWHTYMVFAWR
jgi:FkbM family methyltransferase